MLPSLQRHVFLVLTCLLLLVTSGLAEAKPNKAKKKTTKPTVAILYFDYEGGDEELGYLRKGLTQMLVTDLSDVSSIQLVERTDLEKVLQELELNRSKKIQRSQANKIGKLLGAHYLITGSYFTFKGRMRVDAKLINVERGTTSGVGALRRADEFMQLEIELADKLREKLSTLKGKTASRTPRKGKDRHARKSNKTIKSVGARTVARYGKALDAIDQGDKETGRKLLAKLGEEAPHFKPAADDLKWLLR